MAKTTTDRVYLTEEEKNLLAGMLEEWNGKPNKKSRDDFITTEALPKIQQMNISRYGPDIISKDKAANVLWNKRIHAVYTWFKNNKPYKDRAVFKLERKIPLRRVVGKLRADQIHEMVTAMDPDVKKGHQAYPGCFQKALTSLMKELTEDEMEEMETVCSEWQVSGPPIDVRLKAARKYSRKGIINAHQLLQKEMYVSCITFSFYPEPDTGVVAVVCHDYISDLHSKSHGNKFKTFKEWNAQGYSRIVQDMIGYANYVDKQRREECVMDPEALPEVINFEKGPGGLPLLPLEVKGLRGLETAKHAREIIRAFFLRHYQLATGCQNARTPWAVIGEDPSKFFDLTCLPPNFKFQDPSRMGVHVRDLLNHLRDRQMHLGVEAFQFLHVLRNNNLEPSEYPTEAQDSLSRKDNVGGDPSTFSQGPSTSEEVLPASPSKGGRKSPRKNQKAKVIKRHDILEDNLPPPTNVEAASLKTSLPPDALGSVTPKIANVPGASSVPVIQKLVFPTEASTAVPTMAAFPPFPQKQVPFQPTLPPLMPMSTDLPPSNPFCPQPPFSAYPFHPAYMAYLHQQQVLPPATWQVPLPLPPDVSMANIDPQLPPGPPIFFNPGHTGLELSAQLPVIQPVREPPKRTPKRKRAGSVVEADNTPSRSNRKRKPTKKYLDSLETDTLVL